MKRRLFLSTFGSLLSPVILAKNNNGVKISTDINTPLSAAGLTEQDNILIVIQLIGGNDGLNSFIPLDQYSQLHHHRSNILIKENKILKVSDTNGFHPELKSFQKLFLDGNMCCIQDVGYPNQNRSHFRSMDIWNSGSPYNETWDSGWLGRYLDINHYNYPTDYPNERHPDPIAITLGNIVADSCQGKLNNYCYAINNFEDSAILTEYTTQTGLPDEKKALFEFLNSNIRLTNNYTKRVLDAAQKGNSFANYPDNNDLAKQLKMVAKLISGGLSTKVYTLTMGGFDTHAYQTTEDTSTGWHATLLKILSEAIAAFQNDLQKLQISDKVLTITYSEFGRQIASNNSAGTDHGTAAPMFVFGNQLKQQVIGHNPIIDKELPPQAGVHMQYDYRDIYGTILSSWLNLPAENTHDIFRRKTNFIADFI